MSIKAFLKRIEEEIEKEVEKEEKAKAAQKAGRTKKDRKKLRSFQKKTAQAPGTAEVRSRANKAEARRVIEESRQTFRDYGRGGEIATEHMAEEAGDRPGFPGVSRPSQETLRRAVIWSEILGPPKARRR